MTPVKPPATLSAAAMILCAECVVFAVLIGVFVYRTVNYVPGQSVYYTETTDERAAALTEAIVIGTLLVIAVCMLAAILPALLRGAVWARVAFISVAAGLVVYPEFLVIRALFDTVYIDWVKIALTTLGIVGAASAIVLVLAPAAREFYREVNSR